MNRIHEPRTGAAWARFVVTAGAIAWACSLRAADRMAAGGMGAAVVVARVTGTVVAADARAGTFDLMTGVGYALRIRRVRLLPAPALTGRAAARPTPAPGSIVRVALRQVMGAAIADTVVVVEPPPHAVTR